MPIHVVATTITGAREAIATAAALAQTGSTPVHVIAARLLPVEWRIDSTAAPMHLFIRAIKQLVAGSPDPIDVLPCMCRHLTDITQLLPDGAIVVLAGRSHRWWPSREQRLAHDLNALGYRVVFVHGPEVTRSSWSLQT